MLGSFCPIYSTVNTFLQDIRKNTKRKDKKARAENRGKGRTRELTNSRAPFCLHTRTCIHVAGESSACKVVWGVYIRESVTRTEAFIKSGSRLGGLHWIGEIRRRSHPAMTPVICGLLFYISLYICIALSEEPYIRAKSLTSIRITIISLIVV